MYKVTLDTNVILSAYFWQGDSYKVMQLIPHEVKWYISPYILEECCYIIKSPRHKFVHKLKKEKKTLDDILQDIEEKSTLVIPRKKLHVVCDPKDDPIIECADASGSDYLLSKDNDLLEIQRYQQIIICRPEAFLMDYKKSKHLNTR